LLELSILKGKLIQPYYVFDQNRRSSPLELETQDSLRAAIQSLSPQASSLILQTVVIDRDDIPADAEITSLFQRMTDKSYIGYQYDYLARMAKSLHLDALELSVHRDDKLFAHLEGNVEQVGETWRLAPTAPPHLLPLRQFSFPILMLSKLEMEKKAASAGFLSIMEQTWFCHFPVGSRPCGNCNPCRFTIEEGLARRVPWQRRLRASVLRPIKAVRESLKAREV
jgi:hypothetical protein